MKSTIAQRRATRGTVHETVRIIQNDWRLRAHRSLLATPPAPVDQSATNRSVSGIIFSDNGASSYHGQTSALFEESINDRRASKRAPDPTEWVEKGLMAEAALQRECSLKLTDLSSIH